MSSSEKAAFFFESLYGVRCRLAFFSFQLPTFYVSISVLLRILILPISIKRTDKAPNLRNDKRLSEIGTPPGGHAARRNAIQYDPSIDAHSTADSTGTFQLTTVITYILPPASSLLAISRTGHDHSASGFFMLALLLCLPCLPTLCFFFSAFPCTRSSELLTPPCTNDSLMH